MTAPAPAAETARGARAQPLLMAAGTLASRVTGLLWTTALAAVLGVGLLTDAYNAASAVPTMLLVLVTGGTLSSALVPLLSRAADQETRRRTTASLLVALGGVSLAAGVLMALASPLLARLLTLGGAGSGEHEQQVRLVTVLLVALAPQVLLLALSAVTGAVLTDRRRLGLLGWAPVGTNLVFLVLLGVYAARAPDPTSSAAAALLGVISTVAAATGLLLQLLAARDVLPAGRQLRRPERDVVAALRRTGSWTLLYAVTNQIGLVVVLAAAAAHTGAVTAYTWAFAVMQMPYALVGVTVLAATLPRLARSADDGARFDALVRSAATTVLTLLLPAAVALWLFAAPAAALLVGYGATTGEDQALVAAGIRGFAVALLPFTAFQVLTRSCYALDRPAWPALANLGLNAVTVAGALLSARAEDARMLVTVLTGSYAASYVLGCLVLLALLRRGRRSVRLLAPVPVAVVLLGCSAAAGAVLAVRSVLAPGWSGTATEVLAFVVLSGLALGAVRGRLAGLRA